MNYLAGFLLARLLLPLLKASAPSRVVNVASLGQHPIDFDDVMIASGYSGSRAYAQSKLSQIMFTIDLAEELKGSGVTVNSLHPATYMNTTMVRAGGITPISTVEQGGEAILHLVTGDDVANKSGLFFNGMNEARANPQAYDAGRAQAAADVEPRTRRPAGRLTPGVRKIMVSKGLGSRGSQTPALWRLIQDQWTFGLGFIRPVAA